MKESFKLADFFQFERFIAPTFLKVVYILGLIGIGIYALISIIGGLGMLDYSAATGLGMIVLAILGGAFAALCWRILIEIYFVLFGIHERLGSIRDSLAGKPDDEVSGAP
ncbi:DUF4282 domain-containing protein [Citromicrobium bathyomarinum]